MFTSKKGKNNNKTVEHEEKIEEMKLTGSNIKKVLSGSSDIEFRDLYINSSEKLPFTFVCIDGLVDAKAVNDDILKPLAQERVFSEAKNLKEAIALIEKGVVYHFRLKTRHKVSECIHDILDGSVALVFDGEETALTFDIKGLEKRNIEEPANENVLKGAKDSFIEILRVNTSLVRQKIRNKNLKIIEVQVGKQTRTALAVVYIAGITNKRLLDELLKRLHSIEIDGAINTGNIEEYIVDRKFSIFPQIMYTERTDKFCQNILDGRVGLFIDGLPAAYIIPAVINMFFQAPEDYAQNYFVSSVIRFIRYMSALVTLMLPGFYISITTFHPEMIPTDLAVSIIQSKEGVPFPTFVEVIFMLIAFELLLEAGLRLPKSVGQAVSIVGALVVGEAAVTAKLVSPAVVIVIAVTGIAGFVIPNQDLSNSLRLCRFLLVSGSIIAGLFGLTIGVILLFYSMAQMENFGVPYLSPYVANEGRELTQDTVIRLPLFMMKKRPTSLRTTNHKRQK